MHVTGVPGVRALSTREVVADGCLSAEILQTNTRIECMQMTIEQWLFVKLRARMFPVDRDSEQLLR